MISADRRKAVPSALFRVVPARIVLRLAGPDEYEALAMPVAPAESSLPPGRGFVRTSTEIQIAFVGADASDAGQREGLAVLGAMLNTSPGAGTVPRA